MLRDLADLEFVQGVEWNRLRNYDGSAPGTQGKLRELRAALPGWEIELLDADAYPPETGDTYYENARGEGGFRPRAREPGGWVLGEDSGIEVAGLGGRPGVHRRA